MAKKTPTVIKKGRTYFVNPKDVVNDYIYKNTLEFVNGIRKVYAKSPLKALPPGVPGQSCNCPVFLALEGCDVTSVTETININKRSKLSGMFPDNEIQNDDVTAFVTDFDEEGPYEIDAFKEKTKN